MSGFGEQTPASDPFSQIVSNLAMEPVVPRLTDLPLVFRDGLPVRLNAFEGWDLCQDLLDAYAAAKLDVKIAGLANDQDSAGNMIADSLSDAVCTQTTGVVLGDMLAVRGAGLFEVPNIATDTASPDVLDGTHTLFGELVGIGYGPYSHAEPRNIQTYCETKDDNYDLAIDHRIGGLLWLADVSICRTEEVLGPLANQLELALVPIHTDALHIFKAYPEA